MIFSIDNNSDPKEIVVYDTINQLTNMVEWQDILDKGVTNIDSDGNVYEWDDKKKNRTCNYLWLFNESCADKY